MANGKIRFGKQSGGQLALVIPDGVANTEVTLPESGILAKTSDINTAGVELKTIATGTATFTATTNNINLTGIGVGVEIGDVIQISGAEDAKNNSEFTIEVITDNNNIIVNQAHANKGTTKNVAARASDTGVTVKLLAKWYSADDSLGRGWVDVTSSRANLTTYTNNTNRAIELLITCNNRNGTAPYAMRLYLDGLVSAYAGSTNWGNTAGSTGYIPITCTVPKNVTYKTEGGETNYDLPLIWKELR